MACMRNMGGGWRSTKGSSRTMLLLLRRPMSQTWKGRNALQHCMLKMEDGGCGWHRHHHRYLATAQRCYSSNSSNSNNSNRHDHTNHPPHVQQRVNDTITSLSFSGSGFLLCYHLGVAHCLLQHSQQQHDGGSTLPAGPFSASPPHILPRTNIPLLGASGGALVAAALCAGLDPWKDGMPVVLAVNAQARQYALDALHPGFSLIDVVYEQFGPMLRNAVAAGGNNNNNHNSTDDGDKNGTAAAKAFVQRINEHKLLRIALTDRREWFVRSPSFASFTSSSATAAAGGGGGGGAKNNTVINAGEMRATVYVDHYRDVEDILAACILSSYIPGITGPAWGSLDERHSAVVEASHRLYELMETGSVRYAATGQVVPPPITTTETVQAIPAASSLSSSGTGTTARERKIMTRTREIYWDGGLVNAFPRLDDGTLIITPLAAYCPHNPTINPALGLLDSATNIRSNSHAASSMPCYQVTPYVHLHMSLANATLIRHLVTSSEGAYLEQQFQRGYDHALRFLHQQQHQHEEAEEKEEVLV